MTYDERKITLSLEDKVRTPDISEYSTDGYSVPTSLNLDFSKLPFTMEPATLTVDVDAESFRTPGVIVWLMFSTDDEPWFKLTMGEAAQLRDRLNDQLSVYDTLSDEDKAKANS